MPIEYTISYEGLAETRIEIDTEKFTPKDAEDFLNFFGDWDWDEDPIDEAAKKIAFEAIRSYPFGHTLSVVLHCFEKREGYPQLDGSTGVKLTNFESYDFDEKNILVVEKGEVTG